VLHEDPTSFPEAKSLG